ncbi:alpha-L-rhamnosidase N-terminal domain-containing protein [Phaeosphaeria sp. MPI-PUGE-AT-0046c]|nr:alpha-L-rhamnosidase N-terminal domain-containing protein [Phaeosphaeria sp. MPI-PUGE-AT-0046c]
MAQITDLCFEHYQSAFATGVDEPKPRLSWKIQSPSTDFEQSSYEIEVFDESSPLTQSRLQLKKVNSSSSTLVPWPVDKPLRSRQKISARVRVWDVQGGVTSWSESARLEVGLLQPSDWHCDRIAAPWSQESSAPQPEQLFRKEFPLGDIVDKARLYITAQGVYEANINGSCIGDYFLAPGWTSYDERLQYQTYDVTSALTTGTNCLGIRVAEGWFSGRIGFEGGRRGIKDKIRLWVDPLLRDQAQDKECISHVTTAQ